MLQRCFLLTVIIPNFVIIEYMSIKQDDKIFT